MFADAIVPQNVKNGQALSHGGDDGLLVTFYTKGIHLEEQSKQAGRPVFKDVVFVRIVTPGDALNIFDQPAKPHHYTRFPKHWEAFQKGMEIADDGTPLQHWTRMTPSKVLAYASVHIKTVEQVANIGDANGGAMPMDWQQDRIAARAYLQAAADSSVVQRQAEQLAERDAEINLLKTNLATLGSQMEQLMARLPAPENAAKAPKAK